jgi:hypothetical protein
MARTPIRATSAPPGPTDALRQEMVKELVLSQQKVLVDYGKQLATAAFAAMGLVFTLTDKWLGHAPDPGKVRLLGIAIALFLVTSVLGAAAAGVFRHRVSLSDPDNVEDELGRVARIRFRLNSVAFLLLVIATGLVGFVAI